MSEKKTPKIYMSFRNNQKAIEVPNGLRTVIRKCIAETLRVTDFVGDADVSVTLVDNERIKRINKEFRDKNKVTDVISFPLGAYDEYDVNPENGAYMLGDIVISMEKAHAQAIEYGHSLVREVGFLATHSTLHLLGYDHEDDPDGEKVMLELQDLVLNNLKITREEKEVKVFKRLGNSFKYAAHGIVFCVRHEMNMRIHIVATMCVLYLSQFYNFTKEQFILLIITCVTVISAEMMNTAIEVVIDKVSPGYSALAKVGKDVAAGAVFVTAVAAVIIGVILFWDIEKFKIIFEFFTGDIWNLAMLTAFACLSYLFIAKGKKRNIKGKMKNE